MVDWVIEAARARGRRPARRRRLAGDARPVRRACDGRRPGEAARHRRRGRGARATALDGSTATCSCSRGDTPLLTAGLLLRALLETHRREDAAATVLSFEPPIPASYGRIVRGADGGLAARSSRPRTRAPDELALARGQLLDLRLRGGEALAGARAARAGERAGRAVPDRRDPRSWSRTATAVAVYVADDPPRLTASTRASSWRRPRPCCATGSTRRTCSPA